MALVRGDSIMVKSFQVVSRLIVYIIIRKIQGYVTDYDESKLIRQFRHMVLLSKIEIRFSLKLVLKAGCFSMNALQFQIIANWFLRILKTAMLVSVAKPLPQCS